MFLTSRPSWGLLKATLFLSLLVHGLLLMWFSLIRPETTQTIRVVSKVNVVDNLSLPNQQELKPRPRLKVPEIPLPDRQVERAGHKGTRPGVGGDPAPAPKSLRMQLPRNSRPELVNPDSNVMSGRSIDGDPNRGNAFGDPQGVHGGTGTGGNGPGGTGGDGDGGWSASGGGSPEALLRAGVIHCNGCHASNEQGVPATTRPINVEMMSQSTGWNIYGGGDESSGCGVDVEFEHKISAEGKVLQIRILKTSQDPAVREAIEYFAEIHEFTPPVPRATTYAISHYRFYPPGAAR